MFFKRASIVGLLLAIFFVSCSGGHSSTPPAPTTSSSAPTGGGAAYLRILNGSPDNATAGEGAITVDGAASVIVGSLPYGEISQYAAFPGNTKFTIIIQSTSWNSTPLSCTLPYGLIQGSYYTIVVAGAYANSGNQGLQCQLFAEPYNTLAGQGQVILHYASPLTFFLGATSMQVGTFVPIGTSPTIPAPIASAAYVSDLFGNTANAAAEASQFAASVSAPIAFYVNPSPLPSPIATATATATASASPTATPSAPVAIAVGTSTPAAVPSTSAIMLPSYAEIGTGNPGALPNSQNYFPIGTSSTFSIYIIDAPAGSVPTYRMVGVID